MSHIIAKLEANTEIRNYLSHFAELKELLNANPNALSQFANNYYNGDENSFIFEKTTLDALFALNPTANGLRAYYGSDDLGNPTIFICTCDIDSSNSTTNTLPVITNILASDQNAGGQYPDKRPKLGGNKVVSDNNFDISFDNG